MSNNFTSHFSADDAALVLIDFQPQMFMGVESHDRNAIKNSLQIIAKSAKLFNVPTVLSTVTAQTFAGPFVPEVTEGVFPGHEVYELQQDWSRQETYQGVVDIMKAHTAFGTQIFYSKWALGGHDSEL
jgi:nicotinamidase-related amidase